MKKKILSLALIMLPIISSVGIMLTIKSYETRIHETVNNCLLWSGTTRFQDYLDACVEHNGGFMDCDLLESQMKEVDTRADSYAFFCEEIENLKITNHFTNVSE